MKHAHKTCGLWFYLNENIFYEIIHTLKNCAKIGIMIKLICNDALRMGAGHSCTNAPFVAVAPGSSVGVSSCAASLETPFLPQIAE